MTPVLSRTSGDEAARERAVPVLSNYEACPKPVLATAFGTRAGVVKRLTPALERLQHKRLL